MGIFFTRWIKSNTRIGTDKVHSLTSEEFTLSIKLLATFIIFSYALSGVNSYSFLLNKILGFLFD